MCKLFVRKLDLIVKDTLNTELQAFFFQDGFFWLSFYAARN